MSRKNSWAAGGAALIFAAAMLVSARGATIYTNEADFIAAIEAFPVFLNEFTNFDYLGQLAHPITACETGICYEIYSQPPIHLVTFDGAVSTVQTNDQIVVRFESGNVRAVGGDFFAADTNGAPAIGSVILSLNDGTTNSLGSQSNTPPGFVGFISTGPLLTNLVVQCASGGARPAISHFYAAVGVATLQTALTATNTLLISWPAPGTGCVLQWCPNLAGTNWTDVAATPQAAGNLMEVVIPVSGNLGLYRLRTQ